ncbi:MULTISPECIES: DUF3099 domain-containing protein [unclassified Cryobacterium]|jgi:hypothetical protein|uniref:DUF3099 domain-containing protein n=1 Tax=unclassified Cryobacterium TaxID=2649013 RepID=UPI002AB47101|nr:MULTISPECIES: DUF3099 domain-containing protein [unclassified Cryobacterium]MDY7543955.1 DUF3099 domain-containing protein [Cryobacterium sp. 5B3]MEA9997686.1 DUF3099 domain-containing protein [Cryobacterium sp. RTS3]MEB0264542.1 DUF3099 domain-containing protein [Cryobacterium sp. 10I5]MEB0275746.1 DUF3099 domain-containing protein [Cryobacterium sp. 5B3]
MKQQSITSLPPSPEAERHARMIKYSVTMGIRMVCIVLMLFVHGWWLLVCAAGAIVLPYFAMIIANVHGTGEASTVVRPGAVQLYRGQSESYRGPASEAHASAEPGSAEATSAESNSARPDGSRGPAEAA